MSTCPVWASTERHYTAADHDLSILYSRLDIACAKLAAEGWRMLPDQFRLTALSLSSPDALESLCHDAEDLIDDLPL